MKGCDPAEPLEYRKIKIEDAPDYIFKVTDKSKVDVHRKRGSKRFVTKVAVMNMEPVVNMTHPIKGIRANKKIIKETLEVADEKGVNIVVLPEFALTHTPWGLPQRWLKSYEKGFYSNIKNYIDGEIVPIIKQSDSLKIVFLNTLKFKNGFDKPFNTNLYITKEGIKGEYVKTYLPGDEGKYTYSATHDPNPPTKPDTIRYYTTSITSIICYDALFPNFITNTRCATTKDNFVPYVIVLPAAWRKDGVRFVGARQYDSIYAKQWEITNQSVAMQNQATVISANLVGKHPVTSVPFAGKSSIVAPWGGVISSASDQKKELLIEEISFRFLAEQEQDGFYLRKDAKYFNPERK
jgi:predicted amidohydrolase